MNLLSREFLLAFWKVHILHHAGEGSVYGQSIAEELRVHGYAISPGTLYPLLARMERNGWLMSRTSGPGSKARKNFTLTGEGRELLTLLRTQVKELFEEVCGEAVHAPARPATKPNADNSGPSRSVRPSRPTTADKMRKKSGTTKKERSR